MRSFLYWHIVNPMSIIKPGVVTQTCNLSTQKVGWEDSRVQGNPGLQGLVSKTKQNKIKTKQAHHPNLPNAVVYVAMHGRLPSLWARSQESCDVRANLLSFSGFLLLWWNTMTESKLRRMGLRHHSSSSKSGQEPGGSLLAWSSWLALPAFL